MDQDFQLGIALSKILLQALCGCRQGIDGDLIAQSAKTARQSLGALAFGPGRGFAAGLHEAHSLMQNLPDQTAQAVGNGPDRALVAETRQQTTEHGLEMAAVFLDRGVGRLIENAAQVAVAFGGVAAMVLFRAFVLSGAGANPGAQLRGGGERGRFHAHFGNHLLRRVGAETGHLRQPRHRLGMGLHSGCGHLIQLFDLLLDQLVALQIQGQQLAVQRLRVTTQGINELLLGAA